MKYKNYILLYLLCLLTYSAFAQKNLNETAFWRGFEHSWTYNHRINRLGDFICSTDSGGISTCHVSASGLGADSTLYTSHYSVVSSPTVAFYSGSTLVKLYGKEKQLLTKTIEVSVPVPEGMRNREQYLTLLNGFDLQAIDRADKLQLLRLSVESAEYAPAINEVRFLLKVALVVNCQSFECSRFNQKTTYKLRVFYQVMGGGRKDFEATPKTLTRHYPWGRKTENHYTSEKQYIIGRKDSSFQTAALGIKSIAVTLDKAHWTVEYNANVTPLAYAPKTARFDFSLDLFFKEWQQGMKKNSAKPQHSVFSSKKRGWCVLDIGVVMIQFREATVTHNKHSGSLYWEGFNAPSNSPKAESEHILLEED